MQGPQTRPTLIGRLANPACEQAWIEFVRLYHDVIYRVARARGLQHVDAEDVTQDVFGIVARKIETFNISSGGSFRGWLHKLARDAAIDRLRRSTIDIGSGDSCLQRLLGEIAADDPTGTLWEIEVQRVQLRLACDRIRDQFSEDTWNCFWFTAIDQQTISETARQLGRSAGSVRVARCRVMARLKKEVQRDDFENSL